MVVRKKEEEDGQYQGAGGTFQFSIAIPFLQVSDDDAARRQHADLSPLVFLLPASFATATSSYCL